MVPATMGMMLLEEETSIEVLTIHP